MKTRIILLASVLLVLVSCSAPSSLSQAPASQKFQDGIYYRPQAESLEKQADQLAAVENLIDRTKSSPVFVKTAGKVDTLFVPDNLTATFRFNHSDSTTTITLKETDWRDQWLDSRWAYAPWTSYTFSPMWRTRLWYYNTWSLGFYDPYWYYPFYDVYWSFGPFWGDPFYYYGWYDPWYGAYWHSPYWLGGSYYGIGYVGGGGMHRHHSYIGTRTAGMTSGGSSRAGVARIANNTSRASAGRSSVVSTAGSSRLGTASRPISSFRRSGSETVSGVPSRTAYSSAAPSRSSVSGTSASTTGRSASAAPSSSAYRRSSSGSSSSSAAYNPSRASSGSYSPSRSSSSSSYSSPSRSSSSSSSSYSGGSHSSGGSSGGYSGGSHSGGGYSGGGASHGGRH